MQSGGPSQLGESQHVLASWFPLKKQSKILQGLPQKTYIHRQNTKIIPHPPFGFPLKNKGKTTHLQHKAKKQHFGPRALGRIHLSRGSRGWPRPRLALAHGGRQEVGQGGGADHSCDDSPMGRSCPGRKAARPLEAKELEPAAA